MKDYGSVISVENSVPQFNIFPLHSLHHVPVL